MRRLLTAPFLMAVITTSALAQPGGGAQISPPSCYGNSAPVTSSCILRDGNANAFANNIFTNSTFTAGASGTTVLTASSSATQVLTGSSPQTFQLPDARTMSNGSGVFYFNNNSSAALTITDNSTATIYTVPAGGYVKINLLSNSTAAGSWDVHPNAPNTVAWGSSITGLQLNNALNTTAQIGAGAASSTSPVFIPQRGTATTGFSGDSTHVYGVVGGSTSFTSTASNFNIPSGATYQVNGTQISAANLSNGTTGSGSVVLATSPSFVTGVTLPSGSTSLSYYQDGTFTPTLVANASAYTAYARQTGYFTRIGKIVVACIDIALSATTGGGTGSVQITTSGLPTSENDNYGYGTAPMVGSGLSSLTSSIVMAMERNATTIDVVQWGATGTTNISNSNITASTAIQGCVTYRAQVN